MPGCFSLPPATLNLPLTPTVVPARWSQMVEAANHYAGAEKTRMLEAVDAYHMYYCDEKDRLDAMKT